MAARAGEPLGRRKRLQDRPKLLAARGTSHRDRRGSHRARPTAAEVLALRRSLAKPHPRVAAVDDGAFARGDRSAPIAAVVLSLPQHVERVALGQVTVDGRDATDRVVRLLRGVGPLDGVRAFLLDGAVLGGFNVVDLDLLYRSLGRPIVAVTRRAPDFPRIRAALRKWFPRDAERRWRLLRAHRLFPIPTADAPIFAAAVGCTRADAIRLVRRSTVRGHWPEPLRVAHLVASAGRAPRTKD